MTTLKTKTTQALQLLDEVYSKTNAFLNTIDASKVGYAQLQELFNQIREDLKDDKNYLQSETLRLGILGGTGSGKSSLANALMGDSYLPESAIIFCTSLPTTIKFSARCYLSIESEIKENIYKGTNVTNAEIKKRLLSICKESENPGNEKKITKITIGLRQNILDGKEIVDVPGFTKGNSLHQALAERYAKHFCDVCIVLINNAGSVEIGSYQGLEALARCFADRLDSTVFIINKCDQVSEKKEIEYIKEKLRGYLPGKNPLIFEISAKNSLTDRGQQYQFQDLLGYLAHISARRNLILVQASIGRLISNFGLLQGLCNINLSSLEDLYRNINDLLNTGIKGYKAKLVRNLAREQILPSDQPKLDINVFDLPQNPLGLGPWEYAALLAESFKSQLSILEEMIQKYQASIYLSYNTQYEAEIECFNEAMKNKVKEFESHFDISTSIETPTIENSLRKMNFDPSKIERLKPSAFKLWEEKIFPGIIVRPLEFWISPISISFKGFSIKI